MRGGSGELNRRITVQKNTPTRSASGGVKPAWTTHATLWAAKRDQSGTETFSAGAERAAIRTIWRILYSSEAAAITAQMRITYDSKTYWIEVIKELGFREGYEIETEARDP